MIRERRPRQKIIKKPYRNIKEDIVFTENVSVFFGLKCCTLCADK